MTVDPAISALLAELTALREANASLTRTIAELSSALAQATRVAPRRAPRSLTVAEAARQYTLARSPGCDWWEKHARQHVAPLVAELGDREVLALTRADWRAFVATRFKGRKPSYVALCLKRWRAIIRWCRDEELIPIDSRHPWEGLKVGTFKPRKSEVKRSELPDFLAAAPRWYRTFVIIALETGLRLRENIYLQWSWIDWERRLIRVPGHIIVDGKRIAIGKGGRDGTAPLTPAAERALRDRERYDGCPWVHARPSGKRYAYKTAERYWRTVRERSPLTPADGEESVRLHDARATAITTWARKGAPAPALVKAARWESAQMLDGYLRRTDDDVSRLAHMVGDSEQTGEPSPKK